MGSRLGRRVVHFVNLPFKLLMSNSFTNIQEIALKIIPSASKIEIQRVLESLYSFEVEKVQTLNMEGKKKKRGSILIAKPDYKKALTHNIYGSQASLYGFEVEKVQILNMEGNKKKRGSVLITKPDYKKAYVTLKTPFSINPNLYPIRVIEEDKKNMNTQSKSNIVEEVSNFSFDDKQTL